MCRLSADSSSTKAEDGGEEIEGKATQGQDDEGVVPPVLRVRAQGLRWRYVQQLAAEAVDYVRGNAIKGAIMAWRRGGRDEKLSEPRHQEEQQTKRLPSMMIDVEVDAMVVECPVAVDAPRSLEVA